MDRPVVLSSPVCLRPGGRVPCADIHFGHAGGQWLAKRPLRPRSKGQVVYASQAARQQAAQQAAVRSNVVSCAYGSVATPSSLGLGLPEDIERFYLFGQIIGQGAYGTVRYAYNKHTNMECAVKVLPKHRNGATVTSRALRKLEREIHIHNKLQDCGNVITLYDAYEDEQNVYLVLEYARGKTLEQYLLANGSMNERETALVIYEVLKVISTCHANNVLHGDVKAANFVFSRKADGRPLEQVAATSNSAWLKAIDFGCSQKFTGTPFAMRVGTPVFMAPEVFMREYGLPADMWSVGILFYELFAARFPFWDTLDECKTRTLDEVMKAVIVDEIDYGFGAWKGMSPAGLDLVKRMLTRDPDQRITAAEALQHQWLVEQGVGVPSVPAIRRKAPANNIVAYPSASPVSAAAAARSS